MSVPDRRSSSVRGHKFGRTGALVIVAVIASTLSWTLVADPSEAGASEVAELDVFESGGYRIGSPAMSNDGAEAVYTRDTSPSNLYEIVVNDGSTVEVLEDINGFKPGYTGVTALTTDADASEVVYKPDCCYGWGAPDDFTQLAVFDRDTDTVERLDVTPLGDPNYGNIDSRFGISDDGNLVAFAGTGDEYSTTISEPWPDDDYDIFVRDRSAGTTTSLTATAGAFAGSESSQPSISADGEWVAFTSERDFDSIETGSTDRDVFVMPATGGTPVRISVDGNGDEATGSGSSTTADEPHISADGRFIVYASNAQNLAPSDVWDRHTDPLGLGLPYGLSWLGPRLKIYIHDRDTDEDGIYDESGHTSTGRVPSPTGDVAWPTVSPDGLTVVFEQRAPYYGPSSRSSEPLDDFATRIVAVRTREDIGDPWLDTGAVAIGSSGYPGGYGFADDSGDLAVMTTAQGDPAEVSVFSIPEGQARFGVGIPSLMGPRAAFPRVSDPVSTATGALHASASDIEFPDSIFGMDWHRSYNSYSQYAGSLGRGWQHSFGQVLTEDPDSGDVELLDEYGAVVSFLKDGGSWLHPPDYEAELAQRLDGSFAVEFSDGSAWEFDLDGLLESKSNWDGQVVSVTRNVDGLVGEVESSTGLTLEFTYGDAFEAAALTEVAASDGRSVSYSHSNGGINEVVGVDGQIWTYNTDQFGRITSEVDPMGVVVHETVYGADGRVFTQTMPSGGLTTFSYDDELRTTQVHDSLTDTSVTYSQDISGRLTSIEDPGAEVAASEYDSDGNLLSFTSRLGGVHERTYDSRGNLLTSNDPANGDSTFTYDSANRVLTATTEATGTTTYTYAGTDRVPSTITDAESSVTTQTVSGGLVTEVTDADGVTTEFRYNSLRQLIETEDELGNITTFEYDAAGRQDAIEMPSGARTETTYDAAGRPTLVVDADGGETETTYDNAGRVVSVEDPTGAVTSYTYDDVTGLVETMTDPLSRVTTYTYDALGQLTRTTFHDSTYVETDHGVLGRVLAERDELGRETSYTHDVDGNIASVEDPAGGVTETTYDTAGRVATTTDAAERVTTFAYDPDTGQLITETAPSGTTSYTYDDLGRVETVTDLRGGVTTTAYTAGGRTDTVTDPVGLVTDHAYDPAGRLSSVTAPGGLVTSYDYDVDSRVTSVTSPEGDVTATTYDPMGRILTVTDPAGVVTTNTWSQRGELLTESTSGAGTIEYSYDAAGQLSWVDDALDKRTSFTYDARGREVTRTDANSEVWTTAYNAAGEVISETDPLARTTSYTYDPAGRVATVADPSGRTVTNTWLPDGLLDGWSAFDGTNTLAADFAYDTAGRRDAATLGGRTWTYAHDAAGDLTMQVDPDGRALGYSYDAAGRRTLMRQPNGTGVAYAYDAAGRVDTLTPTEALADTFAGTNGTLPDFYTWTSTIGTRATMGIDANALHMTVGAPNGSTATLSSKLANSTGGDTTLSYRFDSASTSTPLRVYQSWTSDSENYRVQITANNATATLFKTDGGTQSNLGTFTVPVGTDDYRLRFRQDGNQLKVKAWAANSAEPDTWGLEVTDSAGGIDAGKPRVQIASGSGADNGVTLDNVVHHDLADSPAPLVDYSWDDEGRLTGEDLPGSSERSWTWDDGQLVQMLQTAPGVTRWDSADLDYDAAGRLIEIDHGGGDVAEYTYDAANQLLSEQIDGGTPTAWTYDDLGRRATETKGANTDTYTYDDAGQLTGITHPSGPASAFTYDPAGRRTGEAPGSGGTRSFTYNPAGQLDTYTAASGETQTRRYNPDGSPDTLTNTVSSVTKVWTLDWDHSSGLAELAGTFENGTTGTTNAHTTLARAGGTPWATGTRGPDDFTLGSDTFGSTLETTGINSARSDGYSAWGVPAGSGTLNPRLGYRGEVTNKELLHLRARDYQPATGQFLSTDPLGGVDGTPVNNNPYHYAGNSPIGYIDSTGLRPSEAVMQIPVTGDLGTDLMELARKYARATLSPRTVGGCGSSLGSIVYALGTDACVADDGERLFTLVVSASGIATPNASVSAGLLYSNAQEMNQLTGRSACVSGGYTLPTVLGSVTLGSEVCLGSNVEHPDSIDDFNGIFTIYAFASASQPFDTPLDAAILLGDSSVRELVDYPQCWDKNGPPRVLPIPRASTSPPYFSPPNPGSVVAECLGAAVNHLLGGGGRAGGGSW